MNIIAINNHEVMQEGCFTEYIVGINPEHIVEIRPSSNRKFADSEYPVELVTYVGSIFHVHGTVNGWIKKLSSKKGNINEKISNLGQQGK